MHPQALQSVALAVAEARSVEPVLSRIVLGLLAQERVALAPLNVRKVGRVGGSGEPILASTHLAESPWIARPDWVRRERVVSFAAQPLIFRGEILGVLAVFSRAEIQEAQFERLRTFADHAAVAIANARSKRSRGSVSDSSSSGTQPPRSPRPGGPRPLAPCLRIGYRRRDPGVDRPRRHSGRATRCWKVRL